MSSVVGARAQESGNGPAVFAETASRRPRCLAETSLHSAVAAGDVRLVARLLAESSVELRVANVLGETPLHVAARAGNAAIAQLLLAAGASDDAALSMQDAVGFTPLMRALASGEEGVARVLLARSDVTAIDDAGRTALHLAARRGLARMVPALVRSWPSGIEARDDLQLSALDDAALAGAREVVQALTRRGALVRPESLTLGCASGRAGFVRWLARAVAGDSRSALEQALAIASGANASDEVPFSGVDAMAVTCLLDAGARPSAAALEGALGARREDVGALLVLRAAARESRAVLLRVAAASESRAMVELLVSLGAPIDAADEDGATPLHHAIMAGRVANVEVLLAAGADVRAPFHAQDPMALALDVGSLPIVRALVVEMGLDVRSAAALDEAPVLSALLAGDPSLVSRSRDGVMPLHIAARFGALAAVKVLVGAGADPASAVASGVRFGGRDVSGWTALGFALWHAHTDVAAWLGDESRRMGDRPTLGISEGGLGSGCVGCGLEEALEDWTGERLQAATRPPQVTQGTKSRALSSSFIGLGGGLLREERFLEEELVPWWSLVSAYATGALNTSLLDALGQCVGARDWVEAERLARAFVADHEAPSLPEALGGFGVAGRHLMLASAQQTLGRVLIERHAYGKAEDAFAAAAGALAWWQGGPQTQAIQVLPVHRLWVAVALGRARLEMRLGRLAEAVAGLRDGIASLGGESLAPLRARLLGALAVGLGEAARYGEAIDAARAASAIVPKSSILKQNLATLLGRIGEREVARGIIRGELARVERREVTDVEDVAFVRYAAGLWALLDGRDERQIVMAREELALAHPRHAALGRFDLGLGLALISQGRDDEALTALTRGAAALMRSEDVDALEALSPYAALDYARVLAASAVVHRHRGELEVALEVARTAFAIVVAAEAPEARWPVELELARIADAQGHPATAIYFGKRAVKTLDGIRRQLPPSRELLRAFIDDRMAAFRELADHLVVAGRFLEATAALGALRAEERDDFVTRGKKTDTESGRIPGASDEPALPEVGAERHDERPVKALRAAQRDADAAADALTAGVPDVAAEARLALARKLLRDRRRAFEAWLQLLEGELEAMPSARVQAIAAMNLRDLAGLQGTLGKLGDGVVMVHYLITADRLRAIVTTGDSQVGRESAIAQADLNALVFQFREVLSDPSRDARAAAHALYQALIAPIEDDLAAAKAETLIVSLDGALRYAPIAGLWDGERWLVERYRVVHFARSALHSIMAKRPSKESLAAFGCGRAVPGFQTLTAVPEELESIVKRDADDPDGELPGVVRLDDAFSREALTSALEGKRFSAVHIASHFVLGPGGESESYLLLGDGQRLTLEDIRYDLRFDGVDLLSLSACNTAVGDAGNDGREIEGFASLALRLGARAVLATLWPVSDASTGLFMRTLYRMIKADPKRSRAEVLRLTMLSFIRGEVSLDGGAVRGTRPLSATSAAANEPIAAPHKLDLAHPRYWAPFVFIGNWR